MEIPAHPVDREKLTEELNNCRFIKRTQRKGNGIYAFSSNEAPLLMYEVARLRELAYRASGCGSGNRIDIDEFDTGAGAYQQLVVWSYEDREIIGGYRYALAWDYTKDTSLLSMSHYFRFSKRFVNDYLPNSIELGRAWVNPLYQVSAAENRSIFALDNLWEGIGAVISENKSARYLYGKVTIPGGLNPTARFLLHWFLDHYFRDKNSLMSPVVQIETPRIISVAGIIVHGSDIEQDFRIIANYLKSINITIPPLITAYLRLAKRVKTFGTTLNAGLGNAFETGIMIKVNDIHPEKYARYVLQSKASMATTGQHTH